jgi:hypothetical protein
MKLGRLGILTLIYGFALPGQDLQIAIQLRRTDTSAANVSGNHPGWGTLRHIKWEDLTDAGRVLAGDLGFRADSFNSQVQAIVQRTAERMREGELDHLIYYLLQSRSFTTAPPIEPARSAFVYMSSPNPTISADVTRRIDDLARALLHPADERQRYFAGLTQPGAAKAVLAREYERAMRFLYRKEADCPKAARPQECVAELYQSRGHSTDTSPNSTDSIVAALGWMRENLPRTISRVLVIGPGEDLAPRTGLLDTGVPRVYQPQRVTRALIASGLSSETVIVECVDINPRVLQSAASTCNSTAKLNVVTDRPGRSADFDLIIATNVLLYMDSPELLLAFHNIRHMLSSKGVFIHNDARFEAELFGKASGLPAVHFGAVTLDPSRHPVLVDRFIVHVPATPKL